MSNLADISNVVIARLAEVDIDAFELDDDAIPARMTDYAEVHVSMIGYGADTAGSLSKRVGYRLQVRVVCIAQINALSMLDAVNTAFHGRRLVVDERRTSPLRGESSDPPGPDDRWFTALTGWTFYL